MNASGEARVAEIGRADAPWSKEVLVQCVEYASGLRLARLRIREGRRFTVLDLDAPTARWLTTAIARALAEDAGDQAAT